MLICLSYRDNKAGHIPQIDKDRQRVPRWVDQDSEALTYPD